MAIKKSKTNKTKKVAKVEAKPAKTEKTTVVQNKPAKKKRATIKEEIKDYLAERNNKVFIGNWKMNMKFDDIKSYFDHFNTLLKKDKILSQMNNLIGIAPTAIGLLPVAGMVKNGVMPVAQFVHHAKQGSYTGCISYDQVHEYNINYAIVGHSETRKMFKLTENDINLVVKTLLENDMHPILCIGDTLEEYEAKETEKSITRQLLNDLKGIHPELVKNVIIAYEPIWAIGRKAATVEQIQRMITFIRTTIEEMFDSKTAKETHVLYGGSVKVENAMDILKVKGLDGFIIGGDSLNPESFYEIIISSQEYARVNSIINAKKIAKANKKIEKEKLKNSN
ncbi:MAG: triose-phosphate isomerase [Mycoplasma sp.]|nr:triose-phosphate isomerase [Mycoplasma sp.]